MVTSHDPPLRWIRAICRLIRLTAMNPPPPITLYQWASLWPLVIQWPIDWIVPPLLCSGRTIYTSVVYLNNTVNEWAESVFPKELNRIFTPHLRVGWFLYSSKWAYELVKGLVALERLSWIDSLTFDSLKASQYHIISWYRPKIKVLLLGSV